MGIDIGLYRIRIGQFCMPKKCKIKLDCIVLRKRTVSVILRLVLFWSVLLTLGGNVELNPGPLRAAKQRTLSFAEVVSSPPSTSAPNPSLSQEPPRRASSRANKDSEVMAFLRDMKTEMRSDLATLNNKIDMNRSVCDLKSENECLRQENQDMRGQIDKLSAKVDNIEGQSRRNNLKFHGIQGPIGEAWHDTESKVRHFISEKLGLTDLQSVKLDRAQRVGVKGDNKCPIVAIFARFKDKETVLRKARQVFPKGAEFSVREDFTERVQMHRRELGKHLVKARYRGQFAAIRFDKLIIDNSVYKYDEMTNEITRIGSTRPGPGGPQNAFGPRDQDTDSRTHPRDQDVTGADQSELEDFDNKTASATD